jgi:hypothetical protein
VEHKNHWKLTALGEFHEYVCAGDLDIRVAALEQLKQLRDGIFNRSA